MTAYTLHPGGVKTDLFKNFKPNACITCGMKCLLCCIGCCLKTPEDGALTTIHCAVREGIEEQSGLYFVYVSFIKHVNQCVVLL